MTDNADKIEPLAKAELFSGVGTEALEKLATIAKRRTFEKDDVIYRVGDTAREVYVLVSGLVHFTLEAQGRPISSGWAVSSRQVFGWAALIDRVPKRVGAAVCLEPSSVLALNGDQLMELLTKDTAAGFLVMKRIAAMIARNYMDI